MEAYDTDSGVVCEPNLSQLVGQFQRRDGTVKVPETWATTDVRSSVSCVTRFLETTVMGYWGHDLLAPRGSEVVPELDVLVNTLGIVNENTTFLVENS
ncbi:hypothetical protein N7535_001490 [Penicillium sp. DV-2018c]|nr:hypothetical protein N7461_005265 [Penicillium sp. DV-2018c]KAJ5582870.1 hypothetical protein N7535_001490 [Penicillium sp. DV-2018c]